MTSPRMPAGPAALARRHRQVSPTRLRDGRCPLLAGPVPELDQDGTPAHGVGTRVTAR